jgi:hypothetical protein
MYIGQKTKLFFFVFLAVFFASLSLCFAATLKWDPPSQGTATGYKVHYGKSSSAPATSVNVGNTTQYYLDNAPLAENTTYYFWVSAYNSAGESPKTGPIPYKTSDSTPPVPPTGVTAK